MDERHAGLAGAFIGAAALFMSTVVLATTPHTRWADPSILALLAGAVTLPMLGLLLHFGRPKLPYAISVRLDDFAWWVKRLGRFSPIVWRGWKHLHPPPLSPEERKRRAEMWIKWAAERSKSEKARTVG
jgi:hypothetical protein